MEVTREQISHCLTAEQLIEKLKTLPKNTLVGLTCDYGDYTHTIQFLPVTRVHVLEDEKIGTSAYSRSGLCVRELEEYEERSEDLTVAVLN